MSDVSGKKKMKSKNNEESVDLSNNYQERIKTTPSSMLSYSPIFSCSQQEDADIAVGWNWGSPKSKPRKFKQKIKLQQSPKLLVKRHPSNDQITAFNKLEQELKTLTDIMKPKENKILSKTKDLQAYLNDSLEEELLICSQQVENNVEMITNNKSTVKLNLVISSKDKMENDSFDSISSAIKDEDLRFKNENKIAETFRKEDSPIKCSPEEIEQKRLQALAKLEAKKKLNIIEQNRLQALKRLEQSRKRRIMN